MDYFDIFESTYDISFGDRKKFPEIFKLNTIDSEKEKVDALIERHSTIDSKNVVIHTTHSARTPKGKTPPFEWWNELLSVFPQHRFYQVGTPVSMGERIPADFNFGNRLTNLTDQRGFLNLRQVAYLIEQTDFFIGVDSVVQHLSLSSNKKGLVIYGSSDCKMAKHDHNHNLSSHRPCSPCIDNANNMNCCLMNRPDLWPKIDTVSRILRENFFLSPPKKSEWLIADPDNKKNIKKNL
jgi:ADP-heptose:LPS heptosyltransferase